MLVRMRVIVNVVVLGLGLFATSGARAQLAASSGALSPVTVPVGGRAVRAQVGRHALVRLRPGTEARSWAARRGLSEARALNRRLGIFRVRGAPGEDGVALAARLAADPAVADAMPDLYLERRRAAIDVPPDDPRYGGQWYLDRIAIEEAWALETGDPDTTIVVVDNGCDMTHPDLGPAMIGGADVRDGDDDPSFLPGEPGNEHGTACAGIAAAVGDNGIGVAGVCPECTLRCVRLLGRRGEPTPLSADIAAFTYAFDVGAAVVSNSWGFVEPIDVPPMLRLVLEDLHDNGRDGRGTLVVFAAGNENRELGDGELTGVRGVVNVGAINLFDEAAPFSNYGASLDLTAPTGTFTTDIQGADGENETDYTSLFGGTSSACPVVAGVAGLMLSADPDASAREVHDLLRATTRPAPFATPDERGHDPLYGYGVVDPPAALRALLGLPEPAPDAGAPEPTDAGAAPDASVERPGGEGGCGCRAAGRGRPGPALALGLALAALLRWRRPTRRR